MVRYNLLAKERNAQGVEHAWIKLKLPVEIMLESIVTLENMPIPKATTKHAVAWRIKRVFAGSFNI